MWGKNSVWPTGASLLESGAILRKREPTSRPTGAVLPESRAILRKTKKPNSLAFLLVFVDYTIFELQLADFQEIRALEKSGSGN